MKLGQWSAPRIYLDVDSEPGQAAPDTSPEIPEGAPAEPQQTSTEPFYKYGEQAFRSPEELTSHLERLSKQIKDKDRYIDKWRSESQRKPDVDVDSVIEKAIQKYTTSLFNESENRAARAGMSPEERRLADIEDRIKRFDPDAIREEMRKEMGGKIQEVVITHEAQSLRAEMNEVLATYPDLKNSAKGKEIINKLVQASIKTANPMVPGSRIPLTRLMEEYTEIAEPIIEHKQKLRSVKADENAAKAGATPGSGAPPPPPKKEKEPVPTKPEEIERRIAEVFQKRGIGL
jgi:hypothetical protein